MGLNFSCFLDLDVFLHHSFHLDNQKKDHQLVSFFLTSCPTCGACAGCCGALLKKKVFEFFLHIWASSKSAEHVQLQKESPKSPIGLFESRTYRVTGNSGPKVIAYCSQNTMGNLRNIPVEMSPFLNLKFVWFGVSLVALILTNGY